jgi:hypothetical protein
MPHSKAAEQARWWVGCLAPFLHLGIVSRLMTPLCSGTPNSFYDADTEESLPKQGSQLPPRTDTGQMTDLLSHLEDDDDAEGSPEVAC